MVSFSDFQFDFDDDPDINDVFEDLTKFGDHILDSMRNYEGLDKNNGQVVGALSYVVVNILGGMIKDMKTGYQDDLADESSSPSKALKLMEDAIFAFGTLGAMAAADLAGGHNKIRSKLESMVEEMGGDGKLTETVEKAYGVDLDELFERKKKGL